ncbi:MAG TPA: hypothetical protein VFB80_18165, partial [Pirellulaceae bacterium]|nr:hypothetical protein [Pirellulaceae bacterium]
MLASWTKLLTISIAAALVGCKSGTPPPEVPPWLAMQPLAAPTPAAALLTPQFGLVRLPPVDPEPPPEIATASWNAPVQGSEVVFHSATITEQP